MSAFLQTLLWVGLIAWALLRFEKTISALFTVVTTRIEDGAELRGPGFVLGASQTPPSEQRMRLRQEAQEVVLRAAEGFEGIGQPRQRDQPVSSDSPAAATPSVKQSFETALRAVSDAKTLGLMWLGMVTGATVLPNVQVEDLVFDGMLRPASGVPTFVTVRLVNDLSQISEISEQVMNLSVRIGQGATITVRNSKMAVLLVTSDHMPDKAHTWPLISEQARSVATWYQVDLRQLRSMYGLEVDENGLNTVS
ncbi:hypothetical protein AXYL_04001 [Achromobacter xylosoxidans A8]|uniref:Uncharacterized protein n=1 Tax=Achromobacter xylosoxidans (strain A8) TaxID=762376 RepID=E3HSK4_ACHXA|nr:hypothetical protein AXYL_04001 [Achromobacter xylosoxidans A8]